MGRRSRRDDRQQRQDDGNRQKHEARHEATIDGQLLGGDSNLSAHSGATASSSFASPAPRQVEQRAISRQNINRRPLGVRGAWTRGPARGKASRKLHRLDPVDFSVGKVTSSMSLSSAKNYALRAEKSQDAKEAADLLAKAILELVASIEATDAKVKKINKSGG
jgi:hypothetical protein